MLKLKDYFHVVKVPVMQVELFPLRLMGRGVRMLC
jgi:hypothetical protein